ncbi:putative pentatricopeptide repeat-containing protein [Prunus yedoensis var. nudiflora]|uniref:Putative pentatricopeptide repeat-containing protein n=1 Tax=Prunus yedoensis var. nudiflora TaxID=2094558 RepID=A0A314V486_PRUYE|nr:putative pentatricopeptide repeat-containing protein [Prunus yedoensis var. nudiflora]
MYFDAHEILRELVLLRRVLPGCDDLMCCGQQGMFVVWDLECLMRCLVFWLSLECLRKQAFKAREGEFSRKFFKDMLGAGITPSVFTYNI